MLFTFTFRSCCTTACLVAALFGTELSVAASPAEKPVSDANVHGQKSDEELLFDGYARAAAAGSSAAQNAIAIAYFTGHGVKRDTMSAIEWLTKAADQGNSDARYNLRAACHTLNNPPVTCSQHGISTAAYFQRPGAKVLWKGDPSR